MEQESKPNLGAHPGSLPGAYPVGYPGTVHPGAQIGAQPGVYIGAPHPGYPGAYPATIDPQQPVHYIVQQPPTYVYPNAYSNHLDLDRKYRTCGGLCCHVRIYAYVIGILELIALVAALIVAIVGYQSHDYLYEYQAMSSCVASFIVGVIVIVALFVGLYKEQALLLIPHIIFQILALIGFCAGIVCYIILATDVLSRSVYDYNYDYDYRNRYTGALVGTNFAVDIVVIVLFSVALAVEIAFLVHMIRCYQYLKEKACNRHH